MPGTQLGLQAFNLWLHHVSPGPEVGDNYRDPLLHPFPKQPNCAQLGRPVFWEKRQRPVNLPSERVSLRAKVCGLAVELQARRRLVFAKHLLVQPRCLAQQELMRLQPARVLMHGCSAAGKRVERDAFQRISWASNLGSRVCAKPSGFARGVHAPAAGTQWRRGAAQH